MSEHAPPDCIDDDGHAWVVGRPVFDDPDNPTAGTVEYNTRQCRRCGYHDDRDPRQHGVDKNGDGDE